MSALVEPGTVLAGKYRIDRVLGQGGMGAVVAARHLQLDEEVAIKFLLPEALANREAVVRFEREARAAVKIKSEHTVRVSDVGTLESGAPYMVMELLRGSDLGRVIQDRGPIPLEDASDYLLQACEAIAEAHSLGIVHRDLKPPNLFLTQRPDGSSCVKVIDFGISKVTNPSGSDADQGMTRTSVMMGSPLYMSPEQLMSARDVDMRADVWSLGVIFYELLTAHAPFSADTLPQLCTTIMTSPPAPIRNRRPDLPAEVVDLILACLEKDRGKRVPSVAEFAIRLAPHAPRRSRLSVERIERLSRAAGFSASALAPASSSGREPPEGRTLAEFGRTGQGAGTSLRWWGVAVAGVLAAVGVAAFAGSRGHRENDVVPGSGAVTSGALPTPPSASPSPASAPPVPAAPAADPPPASTPSAPSAAAVSKPPPGLPPPPSPPRSPAQARPPRPTSSAGPKAPPQAEPPKPAPAPRPNCDPNFYFDAQGQKHFKSECF